MTKPKYTKVGLPIDYNTQHHFLPSTIVNDLEFFEKTDTEGHPGIIAESFGLKDEHEIVALKPFFTQYSSDQSYLTEIQELSENAPEPTESEVWSSAFNSWKELRNCEGFIEKYQFIEWNWCKQLNESPLIMQASSMYSLTSPIISLLLPFILLLVPFFLLRVKGIDITMITYIDALKGIIKHHTLGRLFTDIGNGGWDKRFYVLLSAGFYMLQIYQNACACYRFYTNMKGVTTTYRNLNLYLNSHIEKVDCIIDLLSDKEKLHDYREALTKHRDAVAVLHYKLDSPSRFKISPFSISQIGTHMSLLYKLRYDEDVGMLMDDCFQTSSLLAIFARTRENINIGRMHKCCYGLYSKIKGLYFPMNKKDDMIKNNISLEGNTTITGPNASGKTTLLKATLLSIITCQQLGSGFFSEATIKPFTHIHCYINIPDTSSRDSLFQAEARRCKEIFDSIEADSSSNHLCVFDELYSGTNPEEAVACGGAYLSNLSARPNVKFILTTHFTKLCRVLKKQKTVTNYHMESIPIYGKDTSLLDFKYSFRKQKGVSKARGGIKVLRDLDYPNSIVKQADTIIRSTNV